MNLMYHWIIMMIKWTTDYVNHIGKEEYPIYLIVKDDGTYDLECRFEIYALAWYTIYEESIKKYKEENNG